MSETVDSSKSCPPLDALQFVASGKRAQLSGDIDYNACQDNSNPDFVFQKTRVKIFLELTCQNTDLSFLSGKTLGSLQTGEMEKLCANEGNVLTIFSNLQMDYSIVYKVSGEPDVFSDGKMISSMQTPDGKPCSIIFKAGLSYHGSCEDNNLSIYSNGQFDSSYTKRKWNG